MDWDEFRQRRRSGPGGQGPEFKMPEFRLPKMRIPGSLVAIIVIGIWMATGIYFVGPDERGVILRFGKLNRVTMPGPHYRIPWPIEQKFTPKVTEVKRLEIGFRTIDPGPPARYRDVPPESLMLTGDENIIDLDIIVQYRILDAFKYLFKVRNPHETVRLAAEASLRQVIGSKPIDEALTVGKFKIQEDTKQLLQSILDKYESGLQVVAVQLQDVSPPRQVIDAFKDVASAREDKNRLIREADGYRNSILPETRGRVARIVNLALGYKKEKILKAEGDAARFKNILAEYLKAKDITRTRLYLETMEEILPGIEKFIMEPGSASRGVLPILPLGRGDMGLGKGQGR